MVLFLIIGIIIGSSIGVYALDKLNSNIVLYNNEVTNVNDVKDALDELFLKIPKNLSDVVSVGDYVAYDVSPNSVDCRDYSTLLKGWRVLSISETTVTLIHAGQSECYYHGLDSSASITAMNNLAQKYINRDYVESAHMMNYNEVNAISPSNDLRTIGCPYWLASRGNPNGDLTLYNVAGEYIRSLSQATYGIRPVVVLKSNIKTTGKITDAVGNEAWNLINSNN